MLRAHMLSVSNTEDLWRQFAPELQVYLRRRVRDEATAQDILQEVFVKIHKNLERQPVQERLAPWVFRIAKNTLVDHYRSHRPSVPFDEQEQALLVEAQEAPPHEAMERALGAWLRGQIQELSEPYRRALELTEIEGLSQQDAAVRLGVPYSTLKSQVQRGRKSLGQALARCCRVQRDGQGRVLEVTPRQCGC